MPVCQRRLRDQRIAPAGVWSLGCARRTPLGHQSGSTCQGQSLRPWHPQREALQLIGSHEDAAWARWGSWRLGPSRLLWHLKQRIDRAFVNGFLQPAAMADAAPMACRGCVAKLPAEPLAAALKQIGLGDNPKTPPISMGIQGCCRAWTAFRPW